MRKSMNPPCVSTPVVSLRVRLVTFYCQVVQENMGGGRVGLGGGQCRYHEVDEYTVEKYHNLRLSFLTGLWK